MCVLWVGLLQSVDQPRIAPGSHRGSQCLWAQILEDPTCVGVQSKCKVSVLCLRLSGCCEPEKPPFWYNQNSLQIQKGYSISRNPNDRASLTASLLLSFPCFNPPSMWKMMTHSEVRGRQRVLVECACIRKWNKDICVSFNNVSIVWSEQNPHAHMRCKYKL